MMDFNEIRKGQLIDNIRRQYSLLREYEKRRDLSERPKEIQLFNSEIDSIVNSLRNYILQYTEICKDRHAEVSQEVRSIWQDLQVLKAGQDLILQKQDRILYTMEEYRQDILNRIGTSHRELITTLLSAITDQDAIVVKSAMDAIDQHTISDLEAGKIVELIERACTELLQKNLPTPRDQKTLQEARQLEPIWQSKEIGAIGKLKLSLPLIPTILSYETELNINIKGPIKGLWSRFRRSKDLTILNLKSPQDK
jgi:hypothetical protein